MRNLFVNEATDDTIPTPSQGATPSQETKADNPRSRKERPYVETITRHMGDIALEANVSEEVAFRVSQSFLRKLIQRLMADDWPEGGHMVISNFGRFEWRHWAPRHGYNPRSREALIIPAQKKLRFVVAKKFGEGEPFKALNATVAGISDMKILPAAPRKKRREKKGKPDVTKRQRT
jgi:nucleoid DNA-binding protein